MGGLEAKTLGEVLENEILEYTKIYHNITYSTIIHQIFDNILSVLWVLWLIEDLCHKVTGKMMPCQPLMSFLRVSSQTRSQLTVRSTE